MGTLTYVDGTFVGLEALVAPLSDDRQSKGGREKLPQISAEPETRDELAKLAGCLTHIGREGPFLGVRFAHFVFQWVSWG